MTDDIKQVGEAFVRTDLGGDGSHRDGERDTVRCEHCGERFDGDDVPTTPIPSTVLYLCPHCGRWTEA